MQHSLADLKKQIDDAMIRDRFSLRQRLRRVQKAQQEGRSPGKEREQLVESLDRSVARRRRRAERVPAVQYPDDLPISERVEEIAAAIRDHQVVVVCGETGSGKSTQLPKICLQLGRGVAGMIGHTQPRRIAARSVASRVASELGGGVGDTVGFKIRFTDETDPEATLVKVMTDGVLLAESQSDRFFEQYDTIIVDEAHERSLNIDFLLGMLKRLLPKRPELRVIITSATIDADRFAEFFGGEQPAPILNVEGRTYPVDLQYRPLDEQEDEPGESLDLYQAIANTVQEAAGMGAGDMLVFLPTERDIREAARVLRGRRLPGAGAAGAEVLPLYSRLSNDQQSKIFKASKTRRIVLATNVAESSITVPNIRYVIDTGLARISRYSPRSKLQRLPIEAISRASADQRKGRCGRVGPGVCFRLYSESSYESRDAFTTPEIQRTNLAAVILQTMALKLGAIEQFPFLQPPRSEKVRDGYKTLFELGAIDDDRRLTDLGRKLSRLPVDPRIGRMILAAEDEQCLAEVLIIASALEAQDVRDRPAEKRAAADEQHEKFQHERSDFLAFLNIWDFYHDLRHKLSGSQLRKACRQNFLSFQRIREWLDVHRQLQQMIAPLGLKSHRRRDDYDAIHRALLTGLLSNVAMRTDRNEFTGAGGLKLRMWPGSGLSGKNPNWVIAGELLETSQKYLRTAAEIDPAWIESLGAHLLKTSHSDPHWRAKQGAAMAMQKATLFGLPIWQRRPVPLAPLDPEHARRLLIEEGLVEGNIRTRAKFYRDNQKLLEEIEEERSKTRSRELILEPWVVAKFYESRIPDTIVDVPTLHRWIKNRGVEATLRMRREDLLPDESATIDTERFPPQLSVDAMELRLDYRFEPGAEDDGVTLTVPAEGLSRLSPTRLGWLVPGLLEEKVLALIRGLPKSLRRNFVPAPEAAAKVAARLSEAPQQGDFLVALAETLSDYCGERITAEDLDPDKLPPHLMMNVRVVDEKGKPLESGRDLDALREQFVDESALTAPPVSEVDERWKRGGITSWDFGELPEQVVVRRGGVDVPYYPAMVDQGESVALQLAESEAAARALNRGGLRRLFCLAERKSLKTQASWLPNSGQLYVYGASLPDGAELRSRVAELIGDRAFFAQPGDWPRDEASFQARRKYGRAEIGVATQQVLGVVKPLLENYHSAQLALESVSARHAAAVGDIRVQLQWLTGPGFLLYTPWRWLQHIPRYLQAIASRLDKLRGGGGAKDQRSLEQLQPAMERLNSLVEQKGCAAGPAWIDDDEVDYRWMVEELRVSLFAQELGTSQSVSPQRLEKLWRKLQPR